MYCLLRLRCQRCREEHNKPNADIILFTGERWRSLRKCQRKRSVIRKRWTSMMYFLSLYHNVEMYVQLFNTLTFYTSTVLNRINAVERKHNSEWEEDWGTKKRSKSPKSPSPGPPDMKSTASPKAKSSRKSSSSNLNLSCVTPIFSLGVLSFVTIDLQEHLLPVFYPSPSFACSPLCAVVPLMSSLTEDDEEEELDRQVSRGASAVCCYSFC